MHVLPPGARTSVGAIAVDALADVPEAAQLLSIQVQQLAGSSLLVAHDR